MASSASRPTATAAETEPLLRPDTPRTAGGGHGRFAVKLCATLCSFVVLGLVVSTPGVVLPHLETHYRLDDLHASLIFLVAPVGYLAGARLNGPIHRRLGQRGIAVAAPLCQAVFTGTIAAFHAPPQQQHAGFALFLAATAVGNVGSGLLDGSWCAWAAGLGARRTTNTVQGLLHGSFSVGAGLGPLLAGTMFAVWGWPWWAWYRVLLGAVVLQGAVLCVAFAREDGARYRDGVDDDTGIDTETETDIDAVTGADTETETGTETQTETQHQHQHQHPAHIKGMLQYRVTWICAAYFLAYVGTEAAISGWVVTFLQRARHASPYLASLSSTGFWLGMAAGRLVLGPVTDRVGVRPATAAYLSVAIALQTGLAGLPATAPAALSAALVAAVGLFLGPLFPSGIVVLARTLPAPLHVGAVSFVAAVGQLGAALLPFALGSLSQWLGIWVFQGFILALLAGTLLIWLVFPDHQGPCHAARP